VLGAARSPANWRIGLIRRTSGTIAAQASMTRSRVAKSVDRSRLSSMSSAVGPRSTPPKMIGVTSIPLPIGPGIGRTIRSTPNVISLTRNWPFRGRMLNDVSPASAATSSAHSPAQSMA
jgi:hypothetical protein